MEKKMKNAITKVNAQEVVTLLANIAEQLGALSEKFKAQLTVLSPSTDTKVEIISAMRKACVGDFSEMEELAEIGNSSFCGQLDNAFGCLQEGVFGLADCEKVIPAEDYDMIYKHLDRVENALEQLEKWWQDVGRWVFYG
jgi:hypothetical protein